MQKHLRDLTISEAFELLTDDEKEAVYERIGADAVHEIPDFTIKKQLVQYILLQPTMAKLADSEMKTAWDGFYYPS